jgi:retron-type reverse transcriptase
MNVCHPFFENAQIYHSYATRIGKGTYSALDTAQKYARRNSHVLKLDVRKYFDSISHRILLTKLQTLFQDNILLQIFAQIIDSYGVHPQGFQNPEGVNIGLPIGNLTSQYFANFYLSEFDRFAKETLHCKHYVRYMDDIVVFGNTACELSKISETLTNFLQNNVNLRFKTNFINSTKHGVDFLGYRLFDNRTELASKSKNRYIKKIRALSKSFSENRISENDYQRRMLPLNAFTQYAQAEGFRKNVLKKIGE